MFPLIPTTIEALQEEVMKARDKHKAYKDPFYSMTVLAEEVGELAKDFQENNPNWRIEALQIATVALRIYEEIK